MRRTILFAGLITLGGIGASGAQPNALQGTPGSLFPYAASHEIKIINGVPCRTIFDPNRNLRIPVECARPIQGFVPGSVDERRAVPAWRR
jgi:hypothetical protein